MKSYAIPPCFHVDIQTLRPVTISAVLLSIFLALIVLRFSFRHQTGEGRGYPRYMQWLLLLFAAILLILTKGISMTALQGFLLFLVLLKATVSDIQTRFVSDTYSVMILLIALIEAELSDLPSMFFALLIVGLPQFIVAAIKPGTYGGADIKITTSAAFLLGVWKGLFALIIGLTAAVFISSIVRLIKKQPLHEGIPMLPYLSIGIFLAFIL